MGLKQSIVIKNEFTVKKPGGGSRGGSPGKYVTRYMARKGATEPITPIRHHRTDEFIERYMARSSATEKLREPSDVRRSAEEVTQYGGVAFGYGSIAMSDDELKSASRDIQKAFDKGKTVFKTVLSFDEDYLKENDLVPKDFHCLRPGDYKGNLDQLKLRRAIMNGLDKMGREYDDLQYVGVIQVDTMHVHCHLAMVDKGRGKLAQNGEQKGKIGERAKRFLRRGIDMELDQEKSIQFMASNYQQERQNVQSFVKKMSYLAMDEHGLGQLMLAALPENANLWRADSHDKRMERANRLARQFVNHLFEERPDVVQKARSAILSYADKRQEREGLSNESRDKLIERGYHQIEDKAVNSLYQAVKHYREEDLTVNTRMLDIATSDLDDLAAESDDPLAQFGYRLRSYTSRRVHHMREKHKYKELADEVEDIPDRNENAELFLQFYRMEQLYHAQVQAKYQAFLSFLPNRHEFDEKINQQLEREKNLRDLSRLRDDKSLARMNPDRAEERGFHMYGQLGGSYVARGLTSVLDTRIELTERDNKKAFNNLQEELFDNGFHLEELENGYQLRPNTRYDFEDVKALDLHHLKYDFLYDAPISLGNVENFVNMANQRVALYEKVKDYLESTDQAELLEDFDGVDIERMKSYADELKLRPVVKSEILESDGLQKAHDTIPLSRNLEEEMSHIMDDFTVDEMEFD